MQKCLCDLCMSLFWVVGICGCVFVYVCVCMPLVNPTVQCVHGSVFMAVCRQMGKWVCMWCMSVCANEHRRGMCINLSVCE